MSSILLLAPSSVQDFLVKCCRCKRKAECDAAALRKRSSSKGDVVVEVKPGETITAIAICWMLESYIKVTKVEEPKKKDGKKVESGKKVKPAKPATKKKVTKPAAKRKW